MKIFVCLIKISARTYNFQRYPTTNLEILWRPFTTLLIFYSWQCIFLTNQTIIASSDLSIKPVCTQARPACLGYTDLASTCHPHNAKSLWPQRSSPTCQWNLRGHHPGPPWPGYTDPVTLTSAQLSDLSTWLHWLSQPLATPTNAGTLTSRSSLTCQSNLSASKATMTWLHWPNQYLPPPQCYVTLTSHQALWPVNQACLTITQGYHDLVTLTQSLWPQHNSLTCQPGYTDSASLWPLPQMLGHSVHRHSSLTCQSNLSDHHTGLPWPG